MKQMSVIALLMALLMVASAQLTLDINSASYRARQGFWEINLPVRGGVAPYIYTYQFVQGTWRQQGNLILIPIALAEAGGDWILRVVIADALGNRLQRTLLIRITGGNVFVGEYGYDQLLSSLAGLSTSLSPITSTLVRTTTGNTLTGTGLNLGQLLLTGTGAGGLTTGSGSLTTGSGSLTTGSGSTTLGNLITGSTGVGGLNSGSSSSTTTTTTSTTTSGSTSGSGSGSGFSVATPIITTAGSVPLTSGINLASLLAGGSGSLGGVSGSSGSATSSIITTGTTGLGSGLNLGGLTITGGSGSGVGNTIISTVSPISPPITGPVTTGFGAGPVAGSGAANTLGLASSTAGAITIPYSGPGNTMPLPTYVQLDAYIEQGDVVSITSVIQKVISSNLTCIQKTGYLNDLLGRIESLIFIKEGQAQQKNTFINTNADLIKSLNAQIATLTAAANNLDLPGLQGQLTTILASQQEAYDRFNAANVDLTPFNLNITVNNQNVNKLNAALQRAREQIRVDGISLTDTDALIEALIKQLEAAREKKRALQARILLERARQNDIRNAIDAYNADNVRLNNQIEVINAQKQTLQANFQALQIQANNIKGTVASYSSQKQQYANQINILKNQLNPLLQNTDDLDLNQINIRIANLKNSIPTLRGTIDRVRFNCNGAVNYTVNTVDGYITYTFGSSAFRTFVTNEYGRQNSNAAQAFLGPISNVTLTPVTVYSEQWINRFGLPFSRQANRITSGGLIGLGGASGSSSSGLSTGFGGVSGSTTTTTGGLTQVTSTVNDRISQINQFNSDFSCVATANLDFGSGTITNINSSFVTVTLSDGKTARLNLGSCSNILLLNQNEGKIGNTIFFRGVLLPNGAYNVYTALLV